MGKYRVCVYAIARDELQFAERWYASVQEADGVYVLDTGSTDGTPERLRALGAHVMEKEIIPWRFDDARNASLELVPEDCDICVCVDLDEVFHPGWRAAMERVWGETVRQLRYRYTWSFLPDGGEGHVFWLEKAHARRGFQWVNPVHEVLRYTGDDPLVTAEAVGVQLDHLPDPKKSRAQYLPLLELAVQEDPENDRTMHYLGREYLFHGQWRSCEETLKRHLSLPAARWPEERCASMRYLARALLRQGKGGEAEQWLYRAIGEAPYLREPWLEAAELARIRSDWPACLHFAEAALQITERSRSYITEGENWGARPYDLSALAAYYLGLYDLALRRGEAALALSPDDPRLAENLRFYREKAGKNSERT